MLGTRAKDDDALDLSQTVHATTINLVIVSRRYLAHALRAVLRQGIYAIQLVTADHEYTSTARIK